MSVVKETLDRIQSRPVRIVTMEVFDDFPLTVYLDGDRTSPVKAIPLSAESFDIGDRGYAIWQPPLPPIIFSTGDTGWVNVPYNGSFASGTGGQLQYRRINNRVTLRGGADHTTDFTNGATVATIPSTSADGRPIRPVSQQRFMTFGSNRRAVAVDIQTDGSIIAGWPDPPGSGTSATDPWPTSWLGINHTYLVD
jgi:hypothetical protein